MSCIVENESRKKEFDSMMKWDKEKIIKDFLWREIVRIKLISLS